MSSTKDFSQVRKFSWFTWPRVFRVYLHVSLRNNNKKNVICYIRTCCQRRVNTTHYSSTLTARNKTSRWLRQLSPQPVTSASSTSTARAISTGRITSSQQHSHTSGFRWNNYVWRKFGMNNTSTRCAFLSNMVLKASAFKLFASGTTFCTCISLTPGWLCTTRSC